MNEKKLAELSPDLQRRLYDAVAGYWETECWNWMWDSDLFGVIDPAGGDTAYCSVMGREGQHFVDCVVEQTKTLCWSEGKFSYASANLRSLHLP